ncbi:hypothetical protein R1sor_012572 [Riccia sorocarpa]|uniref:5-oxoprolinase n=1 Tax=Riccia sorocarpa TaxID=122646 RepID=A0ABD3I4W0_9MARC
MKWSARKLAPGIHTFHGCKEVKLLNEEGGGFSVNCLSCKWKAHFIKNWKGEKSTEEYLSGRQFRFCIDRGGTFTDVYAEVAGEPGWRFIKLLSVDPANYDDAPREGIRRILEEVTGEKIPRSQKLPTDKYIGLDTNGCVLLSPKLFKNYHCRVGTTVATNALLERKGERTALCVTKGFRDLLRIGNQARPKIFDLTVAVPSTLKGQLVGDCQTVERGKPKIQGLFEKGIHSLAVVFLHSYTFPDHEQGVERIAKELGLKQVSISSALIPMVRAVPRGLTATVDAYLTPVIKDYLNGSVVSPVQRRMEFGRFWRRRPWMSKERTTFDGKERVVPGTRRVEDNLSDLQAQVPPHEMVFLQTFKRAIIYSSFYLSQVYSNWNAPEAVTAAAIIYCLRCSVDVDIPLNQGCLAPVTINIPKGCFLSPSDKVAVVGGYMLTSQRVTDVLLSAFKACACSQGCMNNLTFGDKSFGYYETIGGRRGMVILHTFELREGSGGAGKFKGGDWDYPRTLSSENHLLSTQVSILSERRVHAPRGLEGGQDGARGQNLLFRADGRCLYLGG